MLRGIFANIARLVSQLVHQPLQVLSLCLAIVFVGLVVDGTLFRLWSLYRDSETLAHKTINISKEADELQMKIIKAKDTEFIGHQAREQFELAGEGDLIFVFADEE